MCAFRAGISRVSTDQPANAHQLSHTMAHAAPTAGFLTTGIRSHDLRRGAAQNAAHQQTKLKGHATDGVAESLGHSNTKITKHYTGGTTESVYTARVEKNFQDAFNLPTTDSRYMKRRRLDPLVITDMCKAEGLDPSVKKHREAMSKKVATTSLEVWAKKAEEEASISQVLSEEAAVPGEAAPTPSHHVDEPFDDLPSRIDTVHFALPISAPQLPDPLDFGLFPDDGVSYAYPYPNVVDAGEQSMDPALLHGSLDKNAPKATYTVVADFNLLWLDPRLLTGESNFEGLVETDSELPTAVMEGLSFDEGTAVVEEANFNDVVSQSAPASSSELLLDQLEFVRRFSQINVCTNTALAQKGYHKDQAARARSFYEGGSKDPVTLWVYPCANAQFGCGYQNSFHGAVREHQLSCKIISADAFAESQKIEAFPCDRQGCKSSFDHAGRLRNYINEVHDWKPRIYDKPGCDATRIKEWYIDEFIYNLLSR